MKISELDLKTHKLDVDKMIKANDRLILQKQNLREKTKDRLIELTDYLGMVLDDHRDQEFYRNQQSVDQTLNTLFNQSRLAPADGDVFMVQTNRTSGKSSSIVEEAELYKKIQEEEQQVSSTGLRLRKFASKTGPKVDLVSHGF